MNVESVAGFRFRAWNFQQFFQFAKQILQVLCDALDTLSPARIDANFKHEPMHSDFKLRILHRI